jgi:hypothetical protein
LFAVFKAAAAAVALPDGLIVVAVVAVVGVLGVLGLEEPQPARPAPSSTVPTALTPTRPRHDGRLAWDESVVASMKTPFNESE